MKKCHLLCFDACDDVSVLAILEEHDVDRLQDAGFDLLHHFVAVIPYTNVNRHRLSVNVELERTFKECT